MHAKSIIWLSNHHLITTVVERWRTETHEFHFSLEECMITLEDVALQLGLPIDGEAVKSVTFGDLFSLCEELLGFLPSAKVIKGNTVKLS